MKKKQKVWGEIALDELIEMVKCFDWDLSERLYVIQLIEDYRSGKLVL